MTVRQLVPGSAKGRYMSGPAARGALFAVEFKLWLLPRVTGQQSGPPQPRAQRALHVSKRAARIELRICMLPGEMNIRSHVRTVGGPSGSDIFPGPHEPCCTQHRTSPCAVDTTRLAMVTACCCRADACPCGVYCSSACCSRDLSKASELILTHERISERPGTPDQHRVEHKYLDHF